MYMTIHKDGPEVSGLLSLGADTVSFEAKLTTDNRLDFSKGGLSQKERYTTNGTVKYRIDNVLFDIWNSKISGRLNLYSLSQKEPERPMCFELVRNGQESLAQQCTASKVTVSPNPFGYSFSANFVLLESSPVKVRIFNVNGMMVWQKDYGHLGAGRQQLTVSPDIKPGRYVLNILAGKQILRFLIAKEGGER
jgi:hypothetical protein